MSSSHPTVRDDTGRRASTDVAKVMEWGRALVDSNRAHKPAATRFASDSSSVAESTGTRTTTFGPAPYSGHYSRGSSVAAREAPRSQRSMHRPLTAEGLRQVAAWVERSFRASAGAQRPEDLSDLGVTISSACRPDFLLATDASVQPRPQPAARHDVGVAQATLLGVRV